MCAPNRNVSNLQLSNAPEVCSIENFIHVTWRIQSFQLLSPKTQTINKNPPTQSHTIRDSFNQISTFIVWSSELEKQNIFIPCFFTFLPQLFWRRYPLRANTPVITVVNICSYTPLNLTTYITLYENSTTQSTPTHPRHFITIELQFIYLSHFCQTQCNLSSHRSISKKVKRYITSTPFTPNQSYDNETLERVCRCRHVYQAVDASSLVKQLEIHTHQTAPASPTNISRLCQLFHRLCICLQNTFQTSQQTHNTNPPPQYNIYHTHYILITYIPCLSSFHSAKILHFTTQTLTSRLRKQS